MPDPAWKNVVVLDRAAFDTDVETDELLLVTLGQRRLSNHHDSDYRKPEDFDCDGYDAPDFA